MTSLLQKVSKSIKICVIKRCWDTVITVRVITVLGKNGPGKKGPAYNQPQGMVRSAGTALKCRVGLLFLFLLSV